MLLIHKVTVCVRYSLCVCVCVLFVQLRKYNVTEKINPIRQLFSTFLNLPSGKLGLIPVYITKVLFEYICLLFSQNILHCHPDSVPNMGVILILEAKVIYKTVCS